MMSARSAGEVATGRKRLQKSVSRGSRVVTEAQVMMFDQNWGGTNSTYVPASEPGIVKCEPVTPQSTWLLAPCAAHASLSPAPIAATLMSLIHSGRWAVFPIPQTENSIFGNRFRSSLARLATFAADRFVSDPRRSFPNGECD